MPRRVPSVSGGKNKKAHGSSAKRAAGAVCSKPESPVPPEVMELLTSFVLNAFSELGIEYKPWSVDAHRSEADELLQRHIALQVAPDEVEEIALTEAMANLGKKIAQEAVHRKGFGGVPGLSRLFTCGRSDPGVACFKGVHTNKPVVFVPSMGRTVAKTVQEALAELAQRQVKRGVHITLESLHKKAWTLQGGWEAALDPSEFVDGIGATAELETAQLRSDPQLLSPAPTAALQLPKRTLNEDSASSEVVFDKRVAALQAESEEVAVSDEEVSSTYVPLSGGQEMGML